MKQALCASPPRPLSPREKRMNLAKFLAILAVLSICVNVSHAQSWKQIGPNPIQGNGYSTLPNATVSGSVTDIAIDPSGSTDSTIYIATSAGGVWKTMNSGASWAPTTDSMPILFIGAVSLDPLHPSVVYAGIGGPWCCFSGGGIYRSGDAAGRWTLLNPNGIFTSVVINRIVQPKSGTLIVATNQGIFKSIDSGDNFGNNPPSFNNGSPISVSTPQGVLSYGNISDLKLDTATATTVYAAIDGKGLYKSTDSGTTFPASGKLFSSADFPSSLTDFVLIGVLFGVPPPPTSDVYITFAQSTRPDNKTIYAFLCLGTNPQPCAMLKSTDLGSRFTTVALDSTISINQRDYDQITGVDPQDSKKVYIGVRQIYYSSDGATSGFGVNNQIDVNGAHTDDHAIAFSPASHFTGPPTRVFVGTDGGFASTAGEGSAPGSQWQFFNKDLATGLLYDVDIGRGNAANNAYSYGAFQDNGTSAAELGSSRWTFQCCGDSNTVAVDPANPLHVLTSNDGCLNTTTNGHDWSGCTGGFPANSPALGLLRFDPDPQAGIAYAAAGKELFQSTDNGNHFSLIHTFEQNITALDQVKSDKNLVWLGLFDGTTARTRTALQGNNAAWTKVLVNGAPSNQSVNGIAIDPTDTSTVVVVYPGFSDSADPPKHVYRTINDGGEWHNIGGTTNGGDNNIPDLPLYAVVIVPTTTPHTIVVGSDVGVQQSADSGKTWQVLGRDFPNVQVTHLALDYSVTPLLLRASTYGRSVYQLEGPCPLCPPPPQCSKPTGCIGPGSWLFGLSCTGMNVGIIYNGNCHDTFGEPRPCYAGSNGTSSVSASWSGSPGPPLFQTVDSQDSPTVCTENAAGQTNCKTITLEPPACPSESVPPTPTSPCAQGQRLCDKFNPPRCVPDDECLVTPSHP
jgi:photosystem II stability/assembly factor-like uncharacterized protein